MNEEQFKLLLDYIEARCRELIAIELGRDSLNECCARNAIEQDLRKTLVK